MCTVVLTMQIPSILHSSYRNPPTIARLGDLNLKVSNEGARPVNYLVVDIFRHPDYKPPAKYNDIALLKLDRRVEFNEFIRPACLYTSNTFEFPKTLATGWGKKGYGKSALFFTYDITVK